MANPSPSPSLKFSASRYSPNAPPQEKPPLTTGRQVYEPLLIVGLDKFANVDIRVRVTGGGHTSQIYAIRQAIAKSIVAYYQKYVDEYAKNQLKQALVQYDRTLLVADNRRCEPKKFGGTYCIWSLVEGRDCKRANVGNRSGSESEIPKVVSLGLWWEWGEGGCCGALLLSWIEVKYIIF